MKEFKDNLRRIRREKDITQDKLSLMTGIDQTQISHYERGIRTPSLKNLVLLSDALGCTIDDLVYEAT